MSSDNQSAQYRLPSVSLGLCPIQQDYLCGKADSTLRRAVGMR